jgi:ketosteroid isomerase-like protein
MRPGDVLLLVLPTCLLAGTVAAQSNASTRVRRTIDAVNTRYVDAYNRGDVAEFSRVYAPDATLMPSNSPAIHGSEPIRAFWQGGWSMGIRNVKLTTTEFAMQGNSVTEVGQYQFDIQPATGAPAHDHGKYVVLWQRNAHGEWKWYRDIFNSDVPAAAPPASGAASGSRMGAAAPGDTVWVAVYSVRPDKRSQYEGFITRFWHAGLDYGARRDASSLRAFRHTRVLYPNRMNRDSTYSYMFVMDPVMAGAEYDIQKLLQRMLRADEAAAEYRTFTESLASGKPNSQQFWTMRQH